MSSWLFNVYMGGVVREVNVRVLGKGLELLSAKVEGLRLTSCYVGKRKVMRCSRYGNGDRMQTLNGEPLEEVDCFQYLGPKVAANEGM